jgi:uncharacterized protein (TIRG00374 family)
LTIENKKSRDWKRIIPGLLISIGALVVVFYFADLRGLLQALQLADYKLVALASAMSLLWLLVRAQAWRTLLREQAGFGQVFWTVNEGYLLNNLLPFRLGEIGRAFLLSRKADLGFWEVFSSILIERVLDLGFAVGLVLVTLPLVVGASWALEAALGAGILVLVGFLTLYLLVKNRSWAIVGFDKLSNKITILKKFGRERVEAFFNGLSILTEGNRFIIAILWIALDWGLALMQYYVLLRAFFPDAELLWAAFALGIAALGIAAPSSPGGVGVFELAVVGALSVFGLDPSISLAYAITTHLIQFLTTGVLGAFGFLRDGESLLDIYRQAQQMPQSPQ